MALFDPEENPNLAEHYSIKTMREGKMCIRDRYAILDKNVAVRPGTRLLGTPEHPLIINKGAIV